ncbi:hypothetical protein DOS67_07590 [Staphylococcus felis]|uniref:competence protein ComK n=1 Tax=Staphylococcus felis TaxID=46127 RepID=UPI000E2434C9|nr:competence protein ComK [Staphylococcus felis]REH95230.1 hypothetical protein DOS67_07590 [Staphylococcus felis]
MESNSNNIYENLLYIKTSESHTHRNTLQFYHYHMHSNLSIKDLLKQILLTYQKDLLTQQRIASELVQTHHLIPIFASKSIILCPLQSNRAPVQYFINMNHVISITSLKDKTKFHFKMNHTLIVPIPFTLCLNKWKAAHALSILVQN